MTAIVMRRRLAVASLCIVSLASGIAACSGAPASTDSADISGAELSIDFPTMYSAFEPSHDYKIPAKVSGVKKVKWSASDPDAVDLDPGTDGTSVMITVHKAGTFTITAKAGSLSGSAELNVTDATPDDWNDGNARYNDGVVIQRGGHHDGGGGGGGADGGWPAPDKQAACTNCHGEGSRMDVEHTPMQTGGYSDQQLIDIFTKAKKPDGVPQRIMPLDRWQKIHQWDVPENVQKGLVVYLRSLEPKSQGPTDWGGGHGGKKGSGSHQ